MEIDKFFYQMYVVGPHGERRSYLGTGFAISPSGGLVTCRHVVDVRVEDEESIGVFDPQDGQCVTVEEIRYPADETFDVAYLPGALGRDKMEFLPVIEPQQLLMGESIYTFGYFVAAGKVEMGYFSGGIVNFGADDAGRPTLTLPFAVIEGLSGAPVLTYHNGPKVVGLAFGSKSSRVLASEVLDYADRHERYRETIHRIVEFGLAYHAATIAIAIEELDIHGAIVSADRVDVPGLE